MLEKKEQWKAQLLHLKPGGDLRGNLRASEKKKVIQLEWVIRSKKKITEVENDKGEKRFTDSS